LGVTGCISHRSLYRAGIEIAAAVDDCEVLVVAADQADRVDDRTYTPTALNYVRPGGRLDFSIGYEITDSIRVDIGGSNILDNEYKSYFDYDYINRDFRYDDTIYTIGIRAKL